MFKSMTGFGAGRRELEGLLVVVEIKTVNGRFLKTSIKMPTYLRAREQELDRKVREVLHRGTVSVSVFLTRTDPAGMVNINEEVVAAYQSAFRKLGLSEESIPTLPGVIGSSAREDVSDAEAGAVFEALSSALTELVAMREQEGGALAKLLADMCERIDSLREQIRLRAPTVVAEYQRKLTERLAVLLEDGPAGVDPQLVAREVALVADRSDVTEEIDRIGSHLDQVRELLTDGDGRKLDFLAQELLREVNTVGSKSSDSEISKSVVELKTIVEQFKEQAANVE